MSSEKKLILGGAQIGQEYGLVRPTSFSTEERIQELFDSAAAAGFTAIDTARTYGQSEHLIGGHVWAGEVHTKLDEYAAPRTSLGASLDALGVDRVDLLYLCHDATRVRDVSHEYWGPEIDALASGTLEFGVAVYPDQVTFPLLDFAEIQVIQIPFNILSSAGTRSRVREWDRAGKKVIARSIFAQGYLLNSSVRTSNTKIAKSIDAFHEVSRALGMDPAELAFRWTLSHPVIDGIILGIGALDELQSVSHWMAEGSLRPEEFLFVESSLEASRSDIDLRKL